MHYKRIGIILICLMATVFLSGCADKEKIDPPKKVTYEKQKKTSENVIMTELYLLDKDNLVVPVSLLLPETKSVAKQALEYLVAEGPVTESLPNGFKSVLPSETVVIGLDVNENKLATVDFSKEFCNYEPHLEKQILQSVVWTLTQFDSIDKVALRVNGHPVAQMPVAKTNIDSELSRNIGINLEYFQTEDIMNTHPVTLYFEKSEADNNYLVPVTRRIENKKDDITTLVNELIIGAKAGSSLHTNLMPDTALISQPTVQNGIVSLNFNENIYSDLGNNEKFVANSVIWQLVLSLTERADIQQVVLQVNGKAQLLDEDGKTLAAPVARPGKVNTDSF